MGTYKREEEHPERHVFLQTEDICFFFFFKNCDDFGFSKIRTWTKDLGSCSWFVRESRTSKYKMGEVKRKGLESWKRGVCLSESLLWATGSLLSWDFHRALGCLLELFVLDACTLECIATSFPCPWADDSHQLHWLLPPSSTHSCTLV